MCTIFFHIINEKNICCPLMSILVHIDYFYIHSTYYVYFLMNDLSVQTFRDGNRALPIDDANEQCGTFFDFV